MEKLFTSFYGYDKEYKPQSLIQIENRQISRLESSYNHYYRLWDNSTFIPEDIADDLMKQKEKITWDSLRSYFPPIDGYSNEEYINFIKSYENGEITVDKDKLKSMYSYTWRFLKYAVDTDVKHFWSLNFTRLINDFFSKEMRYEVNRSEEIFRLIEINEFINRAKDNQSFEDFLKNDEEYKEFCEKLIYRNFGEDSGSLIDLRARLTNLPKFMTFDKNITQKTRRQLLELNKDELKKVFLNVKENPLLATPREKTSSAAFAEEFIKSALTENKPKSHRVYDLKDIDRFISLKLCDPTFWSSFTSFKTKDTNNLSVILQLGLEATRAFVWNDAPLIYRSAISYIYDEGYLEPLNPFEAMAVAYGFSNTKAWCRSGSGLDIRSVIIDKAKANEVDLAALLKLIAYIILNDKEPISMLKDFNWGVLDSDTPSEWIYQMLDTRKKISTARPEFFRHAS